MATTSSVELLGKERFTLTTFLSDWDRTYKAAVRQIALFDTNITSKWTDAQRRDFANVFYHARGHFHDFLWYMGNFAPDAESKKMVVDNILEEFGEAAMSHEQLYIEFAKEIGVDIISEIASQSHYLPEIRAFNQGHIAWLSEHDWFSCLAAFSAYERLDNIDYILLLKLVESLNLSPRGQAFFKVHTKVQHFESTLKFLLPIWAESPEKVKAGFHFICDHQLSMWKTLSSRMQCEDEGS